MKLSGRYRITIAGDTDAFRAASTGHSGLQYLLDRLLSGQEVALQNLAPWGLQVSKSDGLLPAASDMDLIGAYQASQAEPGDPWLDAITAEIERRNLDL